jgi:hypothetical protein
LKWKRREREGKRERENRRGRDEVCVCVREAEKGAESFYQLAILSN